MRVKVYSAPMNLAKKIEVATRGGIYNVARVLGKPILEINKATLSHMGIDLEGTYHVLAVLDGDNLYLYRKRLKDRTTAVKGGSHGES